MSKNKTERAAAPEQKQERSTKIGALVALLKRPDGADLNALVEATGWQAHSVRGAIAGTVKKKLKLDVTTTKVEGRTVYKAVG